MNPHVRPGIRANFLAVLTGQAGGWLIATITFIGVPRFFGPEGAGVLGLGWVYAAAIATVAGLGIGTLLTRETARDPERVAEWFPSAIVTQIALGLALAIVVLGALAATGASATRIAVVGVYCLGVPAMLVAMSAGSVLQGLEHMKTAAVYDITAKGLGLFVLLIAVALHGTPLQFAIMSNVALLLVAQHQLGRVKRLLGIRLNGIRRDVVVRIVRMSLPFATVAIVFAIYQAADVAMLGFLADDIDVGLYTAPFRLFGAALFIPTAIATVVFPRLSSSYNVDTPGFERICERSLYLALLSSLGLALLAIGLGPKVLVLLLGDAFADSRAVLVVFALMIVPTSLSTVAGRIGFASDRQGYMWKVGVVCIAAKLALTPALVMLFERQYGNPALGAAVALLAVELVMFAGMVRLIPGSVWRESGRSLGIVVANATAATLVLLLARPFAGDIAATVIAMAAFVALLAGTRTLSIPELHGMVRTRWPGHTQAAKS